MERYSYPSHFPAQSNAAPQYYQQHVMQSFAFNPNVAPQHHQQDVSRSGNSTVQYRQRASTQAHQHGNLNPQNYLPYQMPYLRFPPNTAPQEVSQYNLQPPECMQNFAPQSYQRGLSPQANTMIQTRANLASYRYTQHQHPSTESHMHVTHPSRPDEGRPHNPRIGAFANYPGLSQLKNTMSTQYAHMPTQMGLPPHQQKAPQHTAGSQYAPPAAFSNLVYPPQHYSHPAPVAPTRQNQDQIRPRSVVDASSVPHLRAIQLQQLLVPTSFDSAVSPAPNSTPPPPYSVHKSIKFPGPVATNNIPSERPLETSDTQPRETVPSVAKSPKRRLDTSDNQPQGTVPSVAKSPKRRLETSNTQPQETVESPPNPAKRPRGRPKIIKDEEPANARVPLPEKQVRAANAILRIWGSGDKKHAWMTNPQYRTINGNAVHVEVLDREKYVQINGQDIIAPEDRAWQEKYEERQEKINQLRHRMEMNTQDEVATDTKVWDQYYNPPCLTILDPALGTRLAVVPDVRISTPNVPLKANSKAARKAAKKFAAKEAKAATMAAARKVKAATKAAEKEARAAEKEARAAVRAAEKEARAAMKAAEKEAKAAAKATTKVTRKPNAARKPSSSSTDCETAPASPVAVSTAPTSPEEFNAHDADEDTDAPTEDDQDDLFDEVDADGDTDATAEYGISDEADDLEQELTAALEAEALQFDEDGYNEDGFNWAGFTADGYDKNGFDKAGFNEEGFARDGFGDDGFDKEGFDRDGLNEGGRDREGYDKDGFDRQGWHRDDSEEE